MAEELEAVAAKLITRLREAERLALEGKTSEAKAILKEVLKEARERGLEKSLRNLLLRVKALLRRKTRR
uniref:aS35 n=1 Tax=Pyrobaculum calidifontis (strain DSM 21063 / JCM 11548 / VA1) TaxID=410359 RepID=UPI000A65E95F